MISVALASYNGEKYIKNQIESILINLSSSDELIISDDGSTDNTINIIKEFNDSRILIVDGPRNGIVQNFENAISYCNGDYVFLSDQDDIWEPNKVQVVCDCFKRNNYILIQHDASIIGSDNEVLWNSFFEKRKVKTGIVKNLIKNSYHGCCIAFDRKLIKEILPMPQYIYLHDEWIGLVAELNGKTFFLREKLMRYRRHSENTSSFTHLPIRKMIQNRIYYIKALVEYKKNG